MDTNIQQLVKFSKTLKVLVVEDNKESREQAVKLLGNFFDDITEAFDGADGLAKFKEDNYELIISDINMPNMNGIDMLKKIREIDTDIPILILSAYNNSSYFLDTIKLNISGYILKPVNIEQLVNILGKIIEKIKLRHEVDDYKKQLETMNEYLESQVTKRVQEIVMLNKDIAETQREIVCTMGAIGETRCKETGNHVKRVAEYSKILALHSGMSEEDADMLKQASPMHDIGKIGIPDAILNASRKLTIQEFEIMKTHAELGYDMLKSSNKELLKLAATVAYEHHEKWNGSGYPRGLKGKEISLAGRITAVADVFDALGNDRIYKKAWPDEDIFLFFENEKGKYFDPELIDIFFDNLDKFLKIRDTLK